MVPAETSFARSAFDDAVARRVRVDLVLKPVTAESDSRLISRFLGTHESDLIALETPHDASGRKVFVPVGWQLGLSFELGNLWLQATGVVKGHDQFPLLPTRRVDVILIARPSEMTSCNRRQSPRYPINPSSPVTATLWPGNQDPAAKTMGRVLNWSEGGLALQLPAAPKIHAGEEVVLRLEALNAREALILRGHLKHYTCQGDGAYLAGIGDLVEVEPGQSPGLMRFLSASS